MCIFGGGTPSPPVNTPSEKPEDSWKAVKATVTPAPSASPADQPQQAAPKAQTKAGLNTTRM